MLHDSATSRFKPNNVHTGKHAFSPVGRVNSKGWRLVFEGSMAAASIEQKALGFLKAFENAGKPVSSVTIDGRKIQLVLSAATAEDEFDRIHMRHGKT